MFAPDLKGFGDNADMPYPYSLNDYLNDVKEYMYKNSIHRPHVIAHSFGARIALLGASTDQQLFGKLVLTGAAGLKSKFSITKQLKKCVFKTLKPILGKQKLKRFYSSDYLALPPLMQQSFVKVINQTLDGNLQFILNPTLLIFGENDNQTPLYMAKRLNRGIKNSKLIIYKNAGHFAFVDCPIKFNLEVKEFLLP